MESGKGVDREVVAALLDALESCLRLARAQRAVLTVAGPHGWEVAVLEAQAAISEAHRAQLEPLFERLLPTGDETPLPPDWAQKVRDLVDGVNGRAPGKSSD
jgi:hypothetical protein